MLGGGWLGLLAPLALLPALPSLALNALSASPWMAAGKAHYSGLVLPFVILGAAAGLHRLRGQPRIQSFAAVALLVTCLVGYLAQGAGPLAANYAPPWLTRHTQAAEAIIASLPPDAPVSASASLVPHLTHRTHAYVFPAVQDAEFVMLDLQASPAPTSAGDVYLRIQSLLSSGAWHVLASDDDLLLLERSSESQAPTPRSNLNQSATSPPDLANASTLHPSTVDASTMLQPPTLISAALIPSPDGAIDVDGPRWTLRTVWHTDQPLPSGTHVDFWIDLDTGERVHVWDIASLWWSPPDQWPTGLSVTVDVPNVPEHSFTSWSAAWSTP
jgi:hypothetical protein